MYNILCSVGWLYKVIKYAESSNKLITSAVISFHNLLDIAPGQKKVSYVQHVL
jgi:hypothetical protein